ncbi:MAG: hypothetical protein V4726_02230 [Verrucomicrobiota bacterium]
MEFPRRQAHGKGEKLRRFCAASLMAGIKHDQQQAAGPQESQGNGNRREGGGRAGNNGFIATGQVAKIKNNGGELPFGSGWQQSGKAAVAGGCHLAGFRADSLRPEQAAGAFNCFRLKIEGENPAFRADLPRQEKSVLSIACCGIDGPVSRPQMIPKQYVTEFDGGQHDRRMDDQDGGSTETIPSAIHGVAHTRFFLDCPYPSWRSVPFMARFFTFTDPSPDFRLIRIPVFAQIHPPLPIPPA